MMTRHKVNLWSGSKEAPAVLTVTLLAMKSQQNEVKSASALAKIHQGTSRGRYGVEILHLVRVMTRCHKSWKHTILSPLEAPLHQHYLRKVPKKEGVTRQIHSSAEILHDNF
mmetsp:Transcript_11329/g.20020  ORF Transcript_11329/g.20020 Transcript_11329/m.20020 type:complete len:112 (+) Transcript_11329:557-892(+)